MIAIRDAFQGYKAEQLLLLGLFRICSGNPIFRDRVSDEWQEKEGKKLLKDIKAWIKEIAGNFNSLIRQDKIGFWRKPRQYNFTYQAMQTYL